MKNIYNHVDPNNLKNHLMNIEIYGDKKNEEVIESIRKKGIITPLVITSDNVIISGHTRNQSAKILGLKEVPVLIRFDLTDELDIREAIIEANRQREKSTEVKAREFQFLKEIEAERAAIRMKTGKPTDPSENFHKGQESGRSSDLAAAKVGMKGRTADKAAEVVKVIDELEAEGETEQAEELRQTLNKSVSGAAKKISEPKKDSEQRTKFDEKSLDDLIGKLVRKIDERSGFVKSKKGHAVCVSRVKTLDADLKTWRAEG